MASPIDSPFDPRRAPGSAALSEASRIGGAWRVTGLALVLGAVCLAAGATIGIVQSLRAERALGDAERLATELAAAKAAALVAAAPVTIAAAPDAASAASGESTTKVRDPARLADLLHDGNWKLSVFITDRNGGFGATEARLRGACTTWLQDAFGKPPVRVAPLELVVDVVVSSSGDRVAYSVVVEVQTTWPVPGNDDRAARVRLWSGHDAGLAAASAAENDLAARVTGLLELLRGASKPPAR